MSLITIEVTPDIAAKIRFLAESGVFAIQNGSASINFHDGQLKSVKTEIITHAPVYTQTTPMQRTMKVVL